MNLVNLSDGNSDGIVLFYLKDHKVYPTVLNEEQADILDRLFSALGELRVLDEPQNVTLERYKNLAVVK